MARVFLYTLHKTKHTEAYDCMVEGTFAMHYKHSDGPCPREARCFESPVAFRALTERVVFYVIHFERGVYLENRGFYV